jgi:hypothetical protein
MSAETDLDGFQEEEPDDLLPDISPIVSETPQDEKDREEVADE